MMVKYRPQKKVMEKNKKMRRKQKKIKCEIMKFQEQKRKHLRSEAME